MKNARFLALFLCIVPLFAQSRSDVDKPSVLVTSSFWSILNSQAACSGVTLIVDERFSAPYRVMWQPGLYFDDFLISYKGVTIAKRYNYYNRKNLSHDVCSSIKEHFQKEKRNANEFKNR